MTQSMEKLMAGVMALVMVASLGAVPVIATSDSSTDDSPLTRDEIAQAIHEEDFEDLSDETTWEIEEFYDRQPFADDVSVSDLQTRDQLAQNEHDIDEFEDLSDETKHEIEDQYDQQFADASEQKKYTRDDIGHSVFGEHFSDLSDETTWEVEEFYDRQPFADDVSVSDLQTRDQLAQSEHGISEFEDLSDETKHEIEDLYDQQFSSTGKQADDGEDDDGSDDDGTDGSKTTTTPEDTTTTTTTTTTTSTSTTTTEEPTTTTTTTTPGSTSAAFFDVTGIDSPEEIVFTRTGTVTVTVENTGDVAGEQTVTVSAVHDNEEFSVDKEVSLDAGETQEVEFDIETGYLKPGTVNVTATSENDSASSSFFTASWAVLNNRTEEPTTTPDGPEDRPEFSVGAYNVSDVDEDGSATITIPVENLGDERDEQNVSITVWNTTASVNAEQEIALDAGETGEVTFDVNTADVSGNVSMSIETDTDQVGTGFILSPPDSTTTGSGSAFFNVDHYNLSATDDGETIVISILVENVGDAAGEQTIYMTVATDSAGTSAEQDIALDAGESGEVTFEVDRSELGTGLGTLDANSRDNGLSIPFMVSDVVDSDSSFTLNTVSVSKNDQEDTFEVMTHVSHHGGDDGESETQTLTATIETDDGTASASRDVEIPAGATDVPVTIEVDRSGLGSGDATVTVTSEDDSIEETVNLSNL